MTHSIWFGTWINLALTALWLLIGWWALAAVSGTFALICTILALIAYTGADYDRR